MKIVMRMCFLWIFVWATLPAEDNSYQLGHGMKLGTLPLYVGGYFSLEYEDLDEPLE